MCRRKIEWRAVPLLLIGFRNVSRANLQYRVRMQSQDVDIAVASLADALDHVPGDRFAIFQFWKTAVKW